MRFHLLSVFWGDEFTDRFGRIALRSLLAPGNLPALAAAHRVVYHIHTSAADADRLSADPAFQEVGKYVEYRVHKVSLTETERRNPSTHWMLWHRGAAQLDQDEDVLITVAPDHLFSRDAMTRWAALFLDGKLAMFCPGVQVVLETLQEEIERSFPVPGPIDVGIDDLHAMMLGHLHPMKITMLRGSPRCILHPEEHLRPIDGYGFVQNVLGSHAVAFRPRAIRVNAHFCPVEHLDRIAFEPCRYLSLEPALKALPLYLHPWRFDDPALSQFGEWGDVYLFDVNLRESRTAHVYALGRSIPAPERRRGRTRLAILRRADARDARCLQGVARVAGNAGARARRSGSPPPTRTRACAGASRHASRSRSSFRKKAPSGRLEASERARLLASGGRPLIAALKAHIAGGRHTIARGDRLVPSDGGAIRMMDGSCYSVGRRGEVRVTAGPIRVDDIDVYVVSRPLVPLALGFPRVTDARLVRWLVDGSARSVRRTRSGAVRRLRQFPRLHAAVVGLRDAWYGRFRRGAADADAVDGPSPAAGGLQPGAGVLAPAMRYVSCTVSIATRCWPEPASGSRPNRGSRGRRRQANARSSCCRPRCGRSHASRKPGWNWASRTSRPDAPMPQSRRSSARARCRLSCRPARWTPIRAWWRRSSGRVCSSAATACRRRWPPWRRRRSFVRIPRGFHEARGRLLLQAGRIDEALDAFGGCMTGYAVYPSFGDLLPRNAAALDAGRQRVNRGADAGTGNLSHQRASREGPAADLAAGADPRRGALREDGLPGARVEPARSRSTARYDAGEPLRRLHARSSAASPRASTRC